MAITDLVAAADLLVVSLTVPSIPSAVSVRDEVGTAIEASDQAETTIEVEEG